jgi:Zn-dependent M28 family amino/carboxypeptidase
MQLRNCLISLNLCLAVGCAQPPEPDAGPATPGVFDQEHNLAAAASLTGGAMRAIVAELSANRYEGRGPGSVGDARTRAYLTGLLQDAGFEPAGPAGGWEQPFDLVGIESAQPATWSFRRGGDSIELKQSVEFIVGTGMQAPETSLDNAELVFVGYGIEAPEYGWDDYKRADLRGKVLLMLNNDPDWDPDLFEGETRLYYGRWSYKYESAARHGAAGAIIVHTTPSAGYPWQVVQTSWTGPSFELPATDEPRIEIRAWVTEDAAQRLARFAGLELMDLLEAARTRDFEPVFLGLNTSIRLRNALARVESANVLGLLEGSDPELAGEVVVYTAHHDHLGVAETPELEDRIYNGARDNAAGVAMVGTIARAFSSLSVRPRRSILIAFVGAEEQGLLGSKYFALHPTVPAGSISAAINYDSPNIWGATHDISFVGLGKSTLDGVARRVADRQDRVLKPDQFPDRGYYYRSDQFSLARVGVPGLYVKSGTEFVGRPPGWGEQQIGVYTNERYHQPSDELTDDWRFDGMEQDARFGFWAGLILANDEEMAAWHPGDEFEAARLEALAATN